MNIVESFFCQELLCRLSYLILHLILYVFVTSNIPLLNLTCTKNAWCANLIRNMRSKKSIKDLHLVFCTTPKRYMSLELAFCVPCNHNINFEIFRSIEEIHVKRIIRKQFQVRMRHPRLIFVFHIFSAKQSSICRTGPTSYIYRWPYPAHGREMCSEHTCTAFHAEFSFHFSTFSSWPTPLTSHVALRQQSTCKFSWLRLAAEILPYPAWLFRRH